MTATSLSTTLSYKAHGDIISRIFELGDVKTWLALRGVSHKFCKRADALLFNHLTVSAFSPAKTVVVAVGSRMTPADDRERRCVKIITFVGPLQKRQLTKDHLPAMELVHTLRIYHDFEREVQLRARFHKKEVFKNVRTVLIVTTMTGRSFPAFETPAMARRVVVNFKYDMWDHVLRPSLPDPVAVTLPDSVDDLVLLFTNVVRHPHAPAISTSPSPALDYIATMVQYAIVCSASPYVTIVGLHDLNRAWLGIPSTPTREEVERNFLCLLASRMSGRESVLGKVEPVIKELLDLVIFVSVAEYRSVFPEEHRLATEL